MLARAWGRALLDSASAESQPHPSLLSPLPPTHQAGSKQARRTRAVPSSASSKARGTRPPFMRGVLLLMAEHFNDWDLQAVVRSCASVAHPEPPAATARPRAAAAASVPRAEAGAEAPPTEPTTPAAAPAAQGHERTPPVLAKGASRLYNLEYLDLDHKPFLLPATPPPPRVTRAAGDDGLEREVMISFPAAAAAASTSGMQPRAAVPPGRKAGARTPRPKRSKKSQLKKVVREMPVADGGASSSDPWAWRKYGQKPIKGSPYPRGYYKCSSMKGCMARKLVERSPAKPGVLIVTYMAEHCHPVPTQLNALAGTTRHKPSASGAASAEDNNAVSSSPKSHEQGGQSAGRDGAAEDAARCDVDSNDRSAATALELGAEEIAAADEENEMWPEGMDLDELLAPVDDDFDFEHVMDDEDGVLGRRLSL